MAITGTENTQNNEEWLIYKAKSYSKFDLYTSKAWIITARTLYPKNFNIQYEAYNIEKQLKNATETAKLLEDMLKYFPNESSLHKEVVVIVEALQRPNTDQNTQFQQAVFTSFPVEVQRHLLKDVVESQGDVLEKCRFARLLLERYPEAVSVTGVGLMDALISAEKQARLGSPVNCYRKYMVCDILPSVLNARPTELKTRELQRWLHKAIEFYICYTFQSSDANNGQISSPSPDILSPNRTTFRSGVSWNAAIIGLPDQDANVEAPWDQSCKLLHLFEPYFKWDLQHFPKYINGEWQWQHIMGLHVQKTNEITNIHLQLLYGCILYFFCSLNKYTIHTDPDLNFGACSGSQQYPLVLVDCLSAVASEISEPKPKKSKTEQRVLTASKAVTGSQKIIDNFKTALQCWETLHGNALIKKEFTRLCQHWKTDGWSWMRNFAIDVSIYEGNHATTVEMFDQSNAAQRNKLSKLRCDIQKACCYHAMKNYSLLYEKILEIIQSLPPSSTEFAPVIESDPDKSSHLMYCTTQEVFPFCIHMLLLCFKSRLYTNNDLTDACIGEILVLVQFNWPKYYPLFTEIVTLIQKRGALSHNSLLNYIINIDILEEFAFLRTTEGGKVNLDILPVSSKLIAQQRTVTRGVNKGVKEDFKLSLEKQIAKCNDGIESLIRQFLIDEKELILNSLK